MGGRSFKEYYILSIFRAARIRIASLEQESIVKVSTQS